MTYQDRLRARLDDLESRMATARRLPALYRKLEAEANQVARRLRETELQDAE